MNKTSIKNPEFRRSGTNLARAKLHNHSVVLDVIRTSGSISRAEVARITSLSRQTVQNIVSGLEQSNLVTLSASEVVGRGHPGMDIKINPLCAFSAGFQIDSSEIRGVVCDLQGNVVWKHRFKPEDRSGNSVTKGIRKALEKFNRKHPAFASRLIGIGLAAPGPFVSAEDSEEITNYNGFGLTTTLRNLDQAFDVPLILENDASAAATGEFYNGLGKGLRNFVFVQFGLGIGSGFVVDGKLYRGALLNAGEIGHIVVEKNGLPCSCDNRGCLEQYLSFGAFCRKFCLPEDAKMTDQVFDTVMAEQGAAADEWFSQAAEKFKDLVNILEVVMDPEIIVIGGTAPKRFMQEILKRCVPLHEPISRDNHQKSRVLMGTAGPDTIALGAAAASLEQHFSPSVAQLLL